VNRPKWQQQLIPVAGFRYARGLIGEKVIDGGWTAQ
jgi:hypothetical protein